jgi:hypothetical protein
MCKNVKEQASIFTEQHAYYSTIGMKIEDSLIKCEECAVCSDKISNEIGRGVTRTTIQSSCKHIICRACVRTNPSLYVNQRPCALCIFESESGPSALQDRIQYVYSNVVDFLGRAESALMFSMARVHFLNKAFEGLDRMADLCEGIKVNDVIPRSVRARASMLAGDWLLGYKMAATLIDEIARVRHDELREPLLDMICTASRCLMQLGYLDTARKTLAQSFPVVGESPGELQRFRKYVRSTLHLTAEVFYHLGDFDVCISAADQALDCNRHYKGLYRFQALAYFRKGEKDLAVEAMGTALLYETPWEKPALPGLRALYNGFCRARHGTASLDELHKLAGVTPIVAIEGEVKAQSNATQSENEQETSASS